MPPTGGAVGRTYLAIFTIDLDRIYVLTVERRKGKESGGDTEGWCDAKQQIAA